MGGRGSEARVGPIKPKGSKVASSAGGISLMP
jgi:hypothetical protein